MMDTNTKSSKGLELYEAACKVIPGGVSRYTIYRKPHPAYASHAQGCHVTDVDGETRIDFANNMASLIHGHAHPQIVEAVTRQLQKGTAFTMATPSELELAELLCKRNPAFQKIRFTNSGTEAVMGTMKAARAFTGKPKIAKAEGSYHGTYDFAEVSQAPNPETWGDLDAPNSVALSHGTPEGVLKDVVVFPFNDIERTIRILDRHQDQLAAVIIDPVPHRVGMVAASTEFIQAIYDWTRQHDALLIFDEVITFRINFAGAQEDYPVKPDLTALGKIIGGGFPVGAFAGRSDVMGITDPGEKSFRLYYSGTFSANPISMTAGHVAMQIFDQQAVNDINKISAVAKSQIEEAARIADVPVCFTGAGSMFRFHPKPIPPSHFREAYQPKEATALIKEILDYMFFTENIMLINTVTCMFSTAITQKEVDRLSHAFLNMFRRFKPNIDNIQPLMK